MVINHFIIPMVIHFLSCWRPPEEDLNYFTALCRNFLWGGDPWIRKMAKVKWDFCCASKIEGGLGIIDIKDMADRLAAKWILRGLLNVSEAWAYMLFKKINTFDLKEKPKWTYLPWINI